MSILDSIKGFAGGDSQVMGFVNGVQGFIDQNGGLGGLKAKFESEGAGTIMQSWISTGPNLPISQDQIQKIMGNQFVQEMAGKMGIDPATAGQRLSDMLPKLMDSLSPDGKMPTSINSTQLMAAASKFITNN